MFQNATCTQSVYLLQNSEIHDMRPNFEMFLNEMKNRQKLKVIHDNKGLNV